MNLKSVFDYFWKLPLCGIAFFISMAINGVALPYLGFKPPEIPEGTDAKHDIILFPAG